MQPSTTFLTGFIAFGSKLRLPLQRGHRSARARWGAKGLGISRVPPAWHPLHRRWHAAPRGAAAPSRGSPPSPRERDASVPVTSRLGWHIPPTRWRRLTFSPLFSFLRVRRADSGASASFLLIQLRRGMLQRGIVQRWTSAPGSNSSFSAPVGAQPRARGLNVPTCTGHGGGRNRPGASLLAGHRSSLGIARSPPGDTWVTVFPLRCHWL